MKVPSNTRFEMQGEFNQLSSAEFQSISQHSEPSGDQDRLDGNSLNPTSGGAGQNQVQPDGGPQGGIPSGRLNPLVPPLQLHRLQQGPHISSGLAMHQWRTTQAVQALTEQSLLMMQQSSQCSLGQIVRPWLREGSPEAPPGEQPLHMPEPPQVPAVQAVQMERPVVPPELLPLWREAAYAMYCQLCASRCQLPLPRDLHLPTPASVLVSNLRPYASQQQVINVFSAFGRITMVEGPQAFNVLAHVPGPGGPFQHPPVMHPALLVQARVHYASRDDAIMAWSTFYTFDPRTHTLPPVGAIANGLLFVSLEVHVLGPMAAPGQYAAHR